MAIGSYGVYKNYVHNEQNQVLPNSNTSSVTKDHYDETGHNEESVVVGIQTTGPLISGAAILMIAVFTGFAFSSMLPIQTLGFGMAVAILLDATVVRLIIVPAAMKLLGRWNWWFPLSIRQN
jgi:RND superfamily putative drug exporter